MTTEKFKDSWQLIYKYSHCLIWTVFCASAAVNVEWEAKYPAHFGNVTYLQCHISDAVFNCTNKDRQWIGGPKYESLCHEDKCTASNKYQVLKQSSCLYTLLIYDFSELDVNCDYTCSYGVSNKRKNLTLDQMRFIYKPHFEDVQEESTKIGNTLNWKINISKTFPTPSCGADQEGKSITDRLQISVTKPGFYFAVALQINLRLSSCGEVNVYCNLGDYKVNITKKNLDSCHLKGGENSNGNNNLMMGLIIFAIIVVITVFMFCVYRKGKLCFNKKNDADRKTFRRV